MKIIGVRFGDEDFKELSKRAKEKKLTVSGYVRHLFNLENERNSNNSEFSKLSDNINILQKSVLSLNQSIEQNSDVVLNEMERLFKGVQK